MPSTKNIFSEKVLEQRTGALGAGEVEGMMTTKRYARRYRTFRVHNLTLHYALLKTTGLINTRIDSKCLGEPALGANYSTTGLKAIANYN